MNVNFPMFLVSERDARAMVRLVADIAGLATDHATAKRRLMDGLAAMIGADCWIWALGYLDPKKPPAYTSIQHGGFSEDRFTRFLEANEHPDMKDLTAPFARKLMAGRFPLTNLRQEIDEAGRFPETAVYPLWLAADIAPLMLHGKPVNDRCTSIIGIYRKRDKPLFNQRDKQIAHILLTEVSWLHTRGWPEDLAVQAPSLSPRQRLVLNLLLEGRSRKAVAEKLNLSVHTVSDYVKEIYKALGVQSHVELMRRFTGKQPAPA